MGYKEMDERLKDLKKIYKDLATPKPSPFIQQREDRLKERELDDLQLPHKCDAAYIYHPMGANLDEIDEFTHTLTEVVDKMKEELVNETRIFTGTDVPEYNENELSQPNQVEEQWKNNSQIGFSKTDPSLTSTPESNSLFGSAKSFGPNYRMPFLSRQSTDLSINSCSESSVSYGIEIGAMNESSECTVPMINELMPGTPNEAK
jgi:hypothetical protein